MIRINFNNRPLGITFDYSRRYGVEVPIQALTPADLKDLDFQTKHNVERGRVKKITLLRPLTTCRILEGEGKDSKVLAEVSKKLHYKDSPFHKGDPRREKFYKLLIKFALAKVPLEVLDKSARGALWNAFLTRSGKSTPPTDSTPNTPASTARGMRAAQTKALTPTPDTVPDGLRIVAAGRRHLTPKTGMGHNVITFPAGKWNIRIDGPVMPWEVVH